MQVRGCFVVMNNAGGLGLKWEPDGQGGGHFTGKYAFLGNVIAETVFAISRNITFAEESKTGTLINGTFDGCFGRLQANKSDFNFKPNRMSDNGPGISVGTVMKSDWTAFISTYSTDISSKKEDLMNSVYGVSTLVWIIALMLTLFTSIAMTIVTIGIRTAKRKNVCVNRSSVVNLLVRYVTSTYKLFFKLLIEFTAEDSYGLKSLPFKFMILMIILLAFYTNFYLTAIIKTEAVTQERPKTIESYDDVLNTEVRPVFFRQYDGYLPYKNSAQSSKKRMIWEKMVRMGIEKSLMKDMDIEGFTSGRNAQFGACADQFLLLKYVCQQLRQLDGLHVRPLVRWEQDEPEYLQVIFKSVHMSRSLSGRFNEKTRNLFEAGFWDIVSSKADNAFHMLPEDDVCMANRVVMPDAGLTPIRLWRIKMLSLTAAAVTAFALIILAIEHLVRRLCDVKKSRVSPAQNRIFHNR